MGESGLAPCAGTLFAMRFGILDFSASNATARPEILLTLPK
jgi:hypothetical protein